MEEVFFNLSNVKKIIIAPFGEMAAENIAPDFDKFGPDDFVALVRFTDGRIATYALGNKFCIEK